MRFILSQSFRFFNAIEDMILNYFRHWRLLFQNFVVRWLCNWIYLLLLKASYQLLCTQYYAHLVLCLTALLLLILTFLIVIRYLFAWTLNLLIVKLLNLVFILRLNFFFLFIFEHFLQSFVLRWKIQILNWETSEILQRIKVELIFKHFLLWNMGFKLSFVIPIDPTTLSYLYLITWRWVLLCYLMCSCLLLITIVKLEQDYWKLTTAIFTDTGLLASDWFACSLSYYAK